MDYKKVFKKSAPLLIIVGLLIFAGFCFEGQNKTETDFLLVYSKEVPVKFIDEYNIVDIPETEFLEQYSLLQKGFQDVSIDIESSQPVFQTVSSHLTKNIEQTSDELTTKTNLSQISLATNYELAKSANGLSVSNTARPDLGEAVNVKQTITLYNNSSQDQETSVLLRHKLNTDKVYWNNEEYSITETPQLFQNPNRVTFYSEDEEYLSLYDYSDIPDKYEPELWAQKENNQSVLLLKLDNLFIPANSSITIDPEYSSLKSKEEIVEQRTLTAKTYTQILPSLKQVNVAEASPREIHYLDKDTGQYEEIDLCLEDKGTYWETTKSSYHLKVPKYADEWFDFKDVRGTQDQTISYKPVCAHTLGKLITDGEMADKQVVYENAFGSGMDLRITAYNNHFLEEVIIREQSENELSFDFEYQVEPEDLGFKSYDMATGEEYDLKSIVSTEFKNREVLFGDEIITYINPMKVWDSFDKTEMIKTKWFKKDGKAYFQKIIPQDFLENAVYPVFTDADTGWKSPQSCGGSSMQDFTNPTNAYTSNNVYATCTRTDSVTAYEEYHNFGFGIPAGATINGIEMNVEHYESVACYVYIYIYDGDGSYKKTTNIWRTSEGTDTLGGSNDLWGGNWTPEYLNSTTNTIMWVQFYRYDTNVTMYLDHLQIKVYYTPVTAPTVTISAAGSVEEATATLNGNVTDTGGDNPNVTMYWGTSNGGTTPGSWTNNSAPTSPVQPQGVASFYKNATSLSPGTLYYFSAKATNSAGTDWPAASLNFTTKPNAPSGLTCSVISQTQINLTWSKGSGAGETLIRRKVGSYPSSTSDGTQVYNSTGTSHNDTTCSCGTHYYYRAWSHKAGAPGSGYSDATSDDNATSGSCVVAPTVTISAAGSVEEATATLNGNVTDTGGDNPNVTMYWGTSNGGTTPGSWTNNSAPTSPVQPQGVAAFYKNATSLSPGTLYYFSAKATNSADTDWPAASLSFTTKPDPPTGLADSAKNNNSITLGWAKGSGAEKTMIRYRTDQYPTGPADGTQAYFDTGATTTVSTLSPDQLYYFRAWSYKTGAPGSGYSDSYADDTTRTYANVPLAPTLTLPTVNSIKVDNNVNSNPVSTEFTLYFKEGATCDGSGGWYIDTNGYASGVAFWQTDTNWGTIIVQGLDENTNYAFCAKARNGDNDVTGWGSGATDTSTDAVPAISAALAQPSPQTVGSKTTFVVEWSAQASFGETVNVHICKTNDLSGVGNTCVSPWCEDLSYTDAKLQTCQYTTLSGDIGSNDFWAFVCDEEVTCTSGTMGTFSVNDISVRLKGGIRLKGNIRLK